MKQTACQTLMLFATLTAVAGTVRAEPLKQANFDRVRQLIRPAADEGLWRRVPWHTSLNDARQQAAEAGKPLLIWAGGGSAPLGGC